MATYVPSDEKMREIFESARRIAVVGLSDKPERDSYRVARYLQEQGYQIIPVNPNVREVLGQKAVASLEQISEPVDIVNVFRRSEEVMPIVEEAIRIDASAIWLQLNVIHEAAAQKAVESGLDLVMDRCIKVEHARLFS